MNAKPRTVPAAARPIIPLLPYQQTDLESNDRFRWNCWSRQTGKSFTKSLRRILRGLKRRRNQIFLSAGERQSLELMTKARQHCQALKITADFHRCDSLHDMEFRQLEIRLPNNVRIIGLPANPQTARGYTGDVFLDEFAMHAHDREIWAAMFPSLLRGDGELDIASTPRGRDNMFYQLRDNPRFAHDTLTLPQAVEQGLRVDPEEMRQAMGDDLLFRQEFLCEFLDEASAFLAHEQISACISASVVAQSCVAPLTGETREMFLGVDVGRHRDLTVMWVLARDGDALVTVGLFELSAAPFRVQAGLLEELLRIRNVRRCCIDAGGLGMQLAEQAVEQFGDHRVRPVTFTVAIKSQLATELRILVESGRIRIPDDDRIVRDWNSVDRSVTQSGHFRFSASRRDGSHADRFWAAALAVDAAGGARGDSPGPLECLTAGPLNFARTGTW